VAAGLKRLFSGEPANVLPLRNIEGTMRITTVEQDQFRWDTNTLTHIPTGATFSWKYPNSGSADVIINWKYAAAILPTGEQFDPEEIEAMARRLMRVHDSS
jgi:hypothetical protein